MKKYFFIAFGLLLSFTSCRKDEKKAYVNYKIVKHGGTNPSFNVSYTLASGGTQTKGPVTADRWLSDVVREVPPGTVLTLSLEANPSATFDMMIYINGALEKQGEGGGGYGTQTITVTVPD
ncbi:MAG: hypothetical protein ACJ77K_18215 [Bacteroidia bacterium]